MPAKQSKNSIPLFLIPAKQLRSWGKAQPKHWQNWLKAHDFKGEADQILYLPDANGNISGVLVGLGESLSLWSIADLPFKLAEGMYHIETELNSDEATNLLLGWKLGSYQFTRYKKPRELKAVLQAPKNADVAFATLMAESICFARDLINTPANDMHPLALADAAKAVATKYKANCKVLQGEQLLKQNFPAIHTVGKGSATPPALVDFTWGNPKHKKVTLIGKGVCFDTGGLDIKSSGNMLLMKKDMGGAANVLALAQMIMAQKLPVRLRVLLPIVENAVSGNAMRPSDVIQTRKGLTVEVGNTDAEGRLILSDALYEADTEKPDLLIDCATLTGAMRVALGTDVPGFLTHSDTLADKLMKHSKQTQDAVWRLPLVKDYASRLKSPIADLNNDPGSSFGGAISAALFLERFVEQTPNWIHIDMMAWSNSTRPGRPVGGDVQAMRACFAMIKEMYERR